MSDQGDLSHLELLKHDTTANTPERDRSGEAPEVNFISEAPQVSGYLDYWTHKLRLILA